MLVKVNRLVKKKDFDNVFKNGRKYSLSGAKIYLKINNNNLEQSRFGFIVSKKVSKKAVVRNKTKRRLREIIRTNLAEIKKGIDVVTIVLPGFEKNDFQRTKETVNNLFQKAKILNSAELKND
jgi:ribonuclease P protein component